MQFEAWNSFEEMTNIEMRFNFPNLIFLKSYSDQNIY